MDKSSISSLLLFILLFVSGFNYAQEPLKSSKIIPIYQNSNYNFNSKYILFSTMDIRPKLGLKSEYLSMLGAFSASTGRILYKYSPIPLRDKLNTTIAGSYELQPNGMYSAFIMGGKDTVENYTLSCYMLFDNQMNVIDTLFETMPVDAHGIAITRDNKVAYSSLNISFEDFSHIGGPDSIKTVYYDLALLDIKTGKDTILFKFRENVDQHFIIQEYIHEGDQSMKEVIDWTHPNSIFEDIDGDILYGNRHVGVGIISKKGEVIAWLGFPDSLIQQQGLPALKSISPGDYLFRLSHDFHQIKKGPYQGFYTLYDNGDINRQYARVLVLDIDKKERTISIVRVYTFPYSPFMGSVDFLEDSTFLVNSPQLPKGFNFIKYKELISTGKNDSLDYFMSNCGSTLYWMTLEGDTIAVYQSSDLNYVYTARVQDISVWPGINCRKQAGTLILSANMPVMNIRWYNETGQISTEKEINVKPSNNYYYLFDHGITTAFSLPLDIKLCPEIK